MSVSAAPNRGYRSPDAPGRLPRVPAGPAEPAPVEDQLKAFGARVSGLRRLGGLSCQQLAQDIQVSCSYVRLIEAGRRSPSIPVLVGLTDALKTSTDYLLGRTDTSKGK